MNTFRPPLFVSLSFLICSTSPPGGNQVDGLPPAASLDNFFDKNHKKMSDLKIIRKHYRKVPGAPGHQNTCFFCFLKNKIVKILNSFISFV